MAKHVECLLDIVLSPNYRHLIDEYGKPAVPSNEVYENISAMLNNNLKAKYIYIIIKENRYGVLDKIQKFHNINLPDSSFSSIASTISDVNTSTRDTTLEFNITFSYRDWISMAPENVSYFDKQQRSRNYCVLRRKVWTDKMYVAIHKATKLPCALVFKTSKISENGIYLTINGSCKECNYTFLGHVVNKPPPKTDVIIECKISNFDESVRHEKKRQLKGQRRTKVSKVLAKNHELPCQWRRAEADKLMTLGDSEPPYLPRNTVLRKAKQERQDINLGASHETDPIKSILKMKYGLHAGTIHSIALARFSSITGL